VLASGCGNRDEIFGDARSNRDDVQFADDLVDLVRVGDRIEIVVPAAAMERVEACALGLGAAAIDFIADNPVGKDGPLAEQEVAGTLVEDRHAGDVGWEEVGRELDLLPRT
jgi:hypothetical protein